MYSQINDKILSDRLSVADILSSMANGVEESNPSVCPTSIDGLTCGIPTRTTPTLTPTTLKNIEESFMEFHTIPPAPYIHQHQAGFAPPIVSFPGIPKQEDTQWMEDYNMHSSDRSLDSPRPSSDTSTCSRPSKTGRTGGRRPVKDERLSPEEEERRRIRRERNKLAAARCRKRRMELTNNLMNETDGLEEKKQALQNEIQLLQCQKEELEFLLEAHKATCKFSSHSSKPKVQDIKPPVNNRMRYHQRPNSLSLMTSYNSEVPPRSSSSYTAVSEMGASLNTPSSGLYHYDGVMEGSAPTSTSGGMPCVISSCSGQQRSSSSDLSSPDSMAPPKLVSL